ncbi:hypothetical protein KAT80_03345 [Candidatus Pacearchaeota archaeon]|nr:hypothetical protein [Candidatus Pacearchaeota archaeon]
MAENPRARLKNYLKKNLKKGYTIESLKWALIKQGYSRTAIEKAIEQIHKELAEKAPVLKEKPVISYLIIDENDNPITVKKSWWKRLLE